MCMRFVILTKSKQASRRCTRVHSSASRKIVSMRIVFLTYFRPNIFSIGSNRGCLTRFARSPTRKMVPIPRGVSSSLVVVFIHVNRKEEEETETEQQQQFTKGCNILHRLQVYHLTLTSYTINIHQHYIYIHTCIYLYYDCSNNNAFY